MITSISTLEKSSRRRLHCLALHVQTPPNPVEINQDLLVADLAKGLMSWSAWNCLLMSLLAGLSTTLGALVVFLMPEKKVSPAQMAFVLSLAAGAMLSVTILEFWLPTLTGESAKPASSVALFSFLGASAFLLLAAALPDTGESVADEAKEIMGLNDTPEIPSSPTPKGTGIDLEGYDSVLSTQARCSFVHEAEVQRRWRLALVMMLSLTAHNLPEGFAVAISALGSDRLGFVVMLAIALHNIPEGIALAVPVLSATGSKRKALWMSFLSGMAEPLGAALALFVAASLGESVNSDALEDVLCVVGGVMCAVALKELLPEAFRQQQTNVALGGLSTGFLVMWLTSYYT
jgi:ZIP family zinc transporter